MISQKMQGSLQKGMKKVTKKKDDIEKEVAEEAKAEEVTAEESTVEEVTEEVLVDENEKKIAELSDKILRITAEYENYRKRTAKEKESLYEMAKADTVAAFLPLFDNIEKAIKVKPTDASGEWKAFSEGVDLMKKQMADILTSLGVTAIDAVGEEFNPELHNAVMHVEDENAGEGVIVEEFQKGFKTGDRVIRHSVVKVAN